MRILVLGGTAFLSAEIARQALAAGHDVTCLARGTDSAPPGGATWLRADRSQGIAAYDGAAASGGWDAVVDVSRDPDQAREALEALAGSARHWTTSAGSSGPTQLAHCSIAWSASWWPSSPSCTCSNT